MQTHANCVNARSMRVTWASCRQLVSMVAQKPAANLSNRARSLLRPTNNMSCAVHGTDMSPQMAKTAGKHHLEMADELVALSHRSGAAARHQQATIRPHQRHRQPVQLPVSTRRRSGIKPSYCAVLSWRCDKLPLSGCPALAWHHRAMCTHEAMALQTHLLAARLRPFRLGASFGGSSTIMSHRRPSYAACIGMLTSQHTDDLPLLSAAIGHGA